MDSSDFLEKKGIDITEVVAYHYTGDPEDGINIDIELLMNEFKDEVLKERAEAGRNNEVRGLHLHSVIKSVCDAPECLVKHDKYYDEWYCSGCCYNPKQTIL